MNHLPPKNKYENYLSAVVIIQIEDDKIDCSSNLDNKSSIGDTLKQVNIMQRYIL